MPNKILLKRSSTAGAVPAAGSLDAGELALNTADMALYAKSSGGVVGRIGAVIEASGAAPLYACRAWVNFNGTGTVAIRASGNVSSITDNGTGDYTVNFTTAMPDANYAVVSSGQRDNTPAANGDTITGAYRSTTSHQTTSYRTSTVDSTGNMLDPASYELAIFR